MLLPLPGIYFVTSSTRYLLNALKNVLFTKIKPLPEKQRGGYWRVNIFIRVYCLLLNFFHYPSINLQVSFTESFLANKQKTNFREKNIDFSSILDQAKIWWVTVVNRTCYFTFNCDGSLEIEVISSFKFTDYNSVFRIHAKGVYF